MKTFMEMVKRTASVWSEAKAPTIGAALSYYTLFSIAPLLVVIVAVAGMVYGPEAASGQVAREIEGTVGSKAAESIQDLVRNANQPASGTVAIVIGAVLLILGASGVFNELHGALDTIWQVEPKPGRGIWGIIKDRFLSFSMVLGTCFIMLVSLAASAALSAVSKFWTPESLPGGTYLWQGVHQLVSVGVITLLFALIYKYLPDVRMEWREVWVGALVTAILFTIGKYLLGLYLGRSSVASAFGAAGSLAVVLVWVYYTAQIFLFGAAFTRVYAESHGEAPQPTENAVALRCNNPKLALDRGNEPPQSPPIAPVPRRTPIRTSR